MNYSKINSGSHLLKAALPVAKRIYNLLLCPLLFLLGTQLATAQSNTFSDNGYLKDNGELLNIPALPDGGYLDQQIPEQPDYEYLYLQARGGDGGYCLYEGQAKGGEGATVKALFKIGNGDNEIAPGSTLRFFTGLRGEKGNRNGGGGGGSAVLLKHQDEEAWAILLVAGGGGGGHIAWSKNMNGSPGNTDTNGSNGGGTNAYRYGGENGYSAEKGHSGGGVFTSWSLAEDEVEATAVDGFYYAEPTGDSQSSGDAAGFGGASSPAGGFGFGSGSYGNEGGGGGGGYSGGGHGDYEGGGGGGSYVNSRWAMHASKIKNGQSRDHKSGYIQFQFLNDPQITINSIAFNAPMANNPLINLSVQGSCDETLLGLLNGGQTNLNFPGTNEFSLPFYGSYTLKAYSSSVPAAYFNKKYNIEHQEDYTIAVQETAEVIPGGQENSATIQVKAFATVPLQFTLYRFVKQGDSYVPDPLFHSMNSTGIFTNLLPGGYSVDVTANAPGINYSKQIFNISVTE